MNVKLIELRTIRTFSMYAFWIVCIRTCAVVITFACERTRIVFFFSHHNKSKQMTFKRATSITLEFMLLQFFHRIVMKICLFYLVFVQPKQMFTFSDLSTLKETTSCRNTQFRLRNVRELTEKSISVCGNKKTNEFRV